GPVTGHLDSDVRGGAGAVEPEAAAGLERRQTQRSEADDAGAEQGSGLVVWESLGDGIDERLGGDGVLSVAAVDGIAGEGRMVAEVFPAGAAVFAGAVGGVQPGDADARAAGEAGAFGFDDADDLMAGDQRRFARGE